MNQWNKKRNKLSRRLFPINEENKDFADNKECFRLFNRLKKKPKKISMNFATICSVILTIIPLCDPNSTYNLANILLLIIGISMTFIIEQGANWHYFNYSNKANKRNFSQVKLNIRFNLFLRSIAMLCWIITVIALASMMFWNGSLSNIW